jgi:hypothetical protein
MDNTPFKYQKRNTAETRESLKEMLLQVQKYRGLFVMLWHNNYFDDDEIPGLKELYLDILREIHNHRPEAVLPPALTERFDGFGQR